MRKCRVFRNYEPTVLALEDDWQWWEHARRECHDSRRILKVFNSNSKNCANITKTTTRVGLSHERFDVFGSLLATCHNIIGEYGRYVI
jgi:hypothetical protein